MVSLKLAFTDKKIKIKKSGKDTMWILKFI